MAFEFALVSVILAIGIGVTLIGWLHPAPTSLRIMRALTWPRSSPDRTDVKLQGVFHLALGAVLLAATLRAPLVAMLALGTVLFSTGVAIGVRRRVE